VIIRRRSDREGQREAAILVFILSEVVSSVRNCLVLDQLSSASHGGICITRLARAGHRVGSGYE